MYYKATVNKRYKDKPGGKDAGGYNETYTAETLDDLFDELEYPLYDVKDLQESGKPIYRDTKDGAKTVGKIYHFWEEQQDRTHGTKSFWTEAWVEITEVRENPIPESLGIESESTLKEAV